jgi:hypothetical protein
MNHAVAEQISDPTARIDDRLVGPGYQAVMQPGLTGTCRCSGVAPRG